MILERDTPPAPHRKTAQNAIAVLPSVTRAKTPAALPEAKQTNLDGVLGILDGLAKR